MPCQGVLAVSSAGDKVYLCPPELESRCADCVLNTTAPGMECAECVVGVQHTTHHGRIVAVEQPYEAYEVQLLKSIDAKLARLLELLEPLAKTADQFINGSKADKLRMVVKRHG